MLRNWCVNPKDNNREVGGWSKLELKSFQLQHERYIGGKQGWLYKDIVWGTIAIVHGLNDSSSTMVIVVKMEKIDVFES